MIVIGGGATGVGVALDAAGRGYKTLLLSNTILGRERRAAAPSWCTAACDTSNKGKFPW